MDSGQDKLPSGGTNDSDAFSDKLALAMFWTTMFLGLLIGVLVSWFNIIYIMLYKPDKTSKRHGGEIVAEVLKAHGVKYIFTLVGGHISPILVAAEKVGIKIIDTRHEATAVFAADAVARLSGTMGVAAVTAGPGLTNTITAVKNAQMAESPVLVIGGAAPNILKGKGALQDIDQMSLFQSLCKASASVKTVRDIIPTMLKLLRTAQSGTPGPVFMEFPVDVLYPYEMLAKEVPPKQNNSIKGTLIHWYIQNYVDNVFSGAWDHQDVTPYPLDIPVPKADTVQKCAELLSKAQKPVLVLGSQAVLPPVPVDKIRRAVELLKIPCFLGGMSRGLLGKASPYQIFHQRKVALKEADLIILAGSVCDFRLSYGRSLSRKAKIIAVNRNKDQLYKNSGTFWSPTVAVQADVGTFLSELSIVLSDFQGSPEWLETLKIQDAEKQKHNEKLAEQPTDEHLNPMKVLFELEKVLPDNAIIVADGGDFVGTAAYILRPRGPLQWLDPGAFGTLGVGGGFALGAKTVHPDSEVWIVYGDGSCGYSIVEYDTYVRHKLPVLSIVGNDAAWMQIAREQIPIFGSDVACRLVHCDYQKVAENFGGKGYLLGRDDNSTIGSILSAAREEYAAGHSVMVNALIGSTKFREGSISV